MLRVECGESGAPGQSSLTQRGSRPHQTNPTDVPAGLPEPAGPVNVRTKGENPKGGNTEELRVLHVVGDLTGAGGEAVVQRVTEGAHQVQPHSL